MPFFSVCEFGFFSAKKTAPTFLKVRRVASQVHQKLFKLARILGVEKKNLQLGTPIEIEIATWRQQALLQCGRPERPGLLVS